MRVAQFTGDGGAEPPQVAPRDEGALHVRRRTNRRVVRERALTGAFIDRAQDQERSGEQRRRHRRDMQGPCAVPAHDWGS